MKKHDFSKLVRRNIRDLTPYHAAEISCSVKLDANESPYSISLEDSLLKRIASTELNRYPDPEAKGLRKAIARKIGLDAGSVLTGNGSDELIYYLTMTFGGPVLYPVPTFSMYGIIASSLGESHKGIPLDKDFDLDVDRMASYIRKFRPKLIFLSSPNNPTGNCFSADRILKIVEMANGVVVLDEAYQPFASKLGFLSLLKDYKYLAILRTLSKVGLAALRVGYLIGDEALLREVNKVRLPFNLNALSQAVATEALKGTLLRDVAADIVSERELLYDALSSTPGVRPYPSEANFIFLKVDDADEVHKRLLKQGVLVRNMNGVVKGALRVTIGTPKENIKFMRALKKAVGGE